MHIVKILSGVGAVLLVGFVISNIIQIKTLQLKNFDEEDISMFTFYLSYNSEEYIKLLSQNGINFRVLDRINDDNTTGLYTGDEIWLKRGYIQKSLNHEIGHFIDDYFGYSKSQKFIEIYNQEHDTISRDYYKYDIEEYFAECYKMYVENWPALNNYPKTKEFFENNVSRKIIDENLTFL